MNEQKNTAELLAEQDTKQLNVPADSLAQGSGPAPVYTPRERYPKRRADRRDLALAGGLLGFCFLLWDAFCWAQGLGLGEGLGMLGLLPAALLYLKNRPGRMTRYGWVCAGLYCLGALSLLLSGDGMLKLFTLCAMLPLYLIVLLERLHLRTGLGLGHRIHDLLSANFSMSLGRLNVGFWALTHCGSADSKQGKRVRAAFCGLLCAIPALLILIPLLISSDAAFEGMLGSLNWELAGRGLFSLSFAACSALLLFTRLFTSDKGPLPIPSAPRKGVEPAAVTAFLGVISAVYLLYLFAQFAYFTDAFRGLLPRGFTVAEYARRGFFEMCAIVAINLILIVLALSLCRKHKQRVPAAVKGLSLFLCAFSLVLVATALSKMILYMGSFGLTRLRLTTSVFMAFLALMILSVALRLFVQKIPVAQLTVTLGAVILIGLSLSNADWLVARYNVDAWRAGKLDSLDMETICELGDGAVPILVELANDPAESNIAGKARRELEERNPERDLRSWNLVTQKAIDALKQSS